MSDRENDDGERASWLRTLYQLAHSDTRWAKEQSWRVVNWTLLLFAALMGLANLPKVQIPATAFVVANVFVLAVAVFYLVGLHRWASSTRGTAARIENELPKEMVELLDRRPFGENHVTYLLIQLAIVAGAFILALLANYVAV